MYHLNVHTHPRRDTPPTGLVLCVVIFSYDVVLTAGADVILERFLHFNSSVVFSAEGFCWPDQDLAVSLQRLAAYICTLWVTSCPEYMNISSHNLRRCMLSVQSPVCIYI